jgi:hypothetical protein
MDYSKRILQTYQKMLSENKLLTEEKLKECYETFRNFFSPEKLKSLDGEVLLDTMFNHGNRGSLVYWLEFKNDDEFPTNKFGGIAGGSSFKFGIYKRKDDGKWITGSSRDIKETSVEEAVNIARGKRDLLVKGAEIIAAMPNNYDDSTYLKLQDDLDSLLGNFGDAAWVHKYFHMLFPDKISEYHAPDFQRFYLLKLLQKPIKDTGRYALDGQYMRMASQLKMHIHYFTAALGEIFGTVHRELMPDYSLLEISIEGLPLGLWLKELNKRICENVGRDARNLQIGHSYFMENGRVIKEFDKLCKVIHEDVIPLLEEYCYGDYTSIAKIIGEGLVDTSNQIIRHDLFNIARKSEFISALLATCPDITTSSKVQTDEQEIDVDEENDEAAGDAEV